MLRQIEERRSLSKAPPPLDLLAGFEAAARLLSFSRAGEEKFVTQSAISRQVKRLEQHLGLQLFERRHRAIELTPQGRVLFEATRETLSRLGATVESLRRQVSPSGVKISVNPGFAAMWLIPRLGRFRSRYPEYQVHIEAENRLVDLGASDVDVAIRYGKAARIDGGDESLLFTEDVFPVCSPSLLRDLGRPVQSLSDITQFPLLHLRDRQEIWPWLQWHIWARSFGGDLREQVPGLSFTHFDQMAQAAAMGQGVALGRSPLVDAMLDEGTLIAPLATRLRSPWAFHVRVRASAGEAAKAFAAWLAEHGGGDAATSPAA